MGMLGGRLPVVWVGGWGGLVASLGWGGGGGADVLVVGDDADCVDGVAVAVAVVGVGVGAVHDLVDRL